MSAECTVTDCGREVRGRGYCNRHYQRLMRHGDPLAGGPSKGDYYKTPEDRFAARTEWRGDCLLWTACEDGRGYGLILVGGKSEKAHRYAWTRINGPIPAGMLIDHICHVPLCVNVDHLRLATRKQNSENILGAPVSNTHSRVLGVHWCSMTGRWRVKITNNGKSIHVGRFDTIAEAEAAAVAKRVELFTYNDADRRKVKASA